MSFHPITLRNAITINTIYSVHYFEYMNNFSFPGESHNFWEFLYVDKGEVDVTAGERSLSLKKGEIVFHQPNEFHSVHANGKSAPNLVVISFDCNSPYMQFFSGKVISVSESEHNLISQIIKESVDTFTSPLGDPYKHDLLLDSNAPFGSEQLICLYLEQMLIQMIRRGSVPSDKQIHAPVLVKSIKQKNDMAIYERVVAYLESHLYAQLTIEQICRDTLVGRSQLQKLFREKNGGGIINFFLLLKIDAAKQMIRENRLNFTQISDQLGFSSIHYFSRQFKKITGMTPSEYASSVKNLSDASFHPERIF